MTREIPKSKTIGTRTDKKDGTTVRPNPGCTVGVRGILKRVSCELSLGEIRSGTWSMSVMALYFSLRQKFLECQIFPLRTFGF